MRKGQEGGQWGAIVTWALLIIGLIVLISLIAGWRPTMFGWLGKAQSVLP